MNHSSSHLPDFHVHFTQCPLSTVVSMQILTDIFISHFTRRFRTFALPFYTFHHMLSTTAGNHAKHIKLHKCLVVKFTYISGRFSESELSIYTNEYAPKSANFVKIIEKHEDTTTLLAGYRPITERENVAAHFRKLCN